MPAKKNHRPWGYIRKLESGRFQASFIGPDAKRYKAQSTFDTKLLAEGWLARQRETIMLATYNGKPWVSPDARKSEDERRGQTVADYGKACIAGRVIKTSTRLHYTDIFAKHIEPDLGEIAIAQLTQDDVNHWYSKLLPDGPTRRAHAYGLLKSICNSAVEADLLTKNPCAIKRAASAPRKHEPVLLTPAELAAVADAIKPERFKAMVLLSGWCAALR